MPLTAADARKWLEGFEAAAHVDREAKRQQGPRPEWAIAVSLSLLRAVGLAAGDRPLSAPTRAAQAEAVRVTWDRARSKLRL
jgi:hypothetical protein